MARQQVKGPSQRQLRVGELIRHALAETLGRGEVQDPALEGRLVTITEVRLSPDLRHATVYARPFGGGETEELIRALNRNARFMRGELAQRVDLKYMPDLVFRLDESFDEAELIDALLRSPDVRRDLD